MKILLKGVNYYWEENHPEVYGTYPVQIDRSININFIPSLQKARKLWDRHVSHKEAESHLSSFIVTSDDKATIYAYYDGCNLFRYDNLSAEESVELISKQADISRLHGEGSYESGWDNFESARQLHWQAEKLENMIGLAKTALAFNYSLGCSVV